MPELIDNLMDSLYFNYTRAELFEEIKSCLEIIHEKNIEIHNLKLENLKLKVENPEFELYNILISEAE